MASIRVTPEELKTEGEDLVKYAEDLGDILDAIKTKVDEVNEGWEGLAQQAYFSMYETLNESLKQFPELVQSLGEATVAAADAYASVDEELQKSFSNAQ